MRDEVKTTSYSSLIPSSCPSYDLRRDPADGDERGEHEPVVVAPVGRGRVVVAYHREDDGHDHEGVVLRAELRPRALARVGLATLFDGRNHAPLRRKNPHPDVEEHDGAEGRAHVYVCRA